MKGDDLFFCVIYAAPFHARYREPWLHKVMTIYQVNNPTQFQRKIQAVVATSMIRRELVTWTGTSSDSGLRKAAGAM
jgi:hypothetical protein